MKWKRYGCIALFVIICILALLFLRVFTKDAGESVPILEWEEMYQVGADGLMQSIDSFDGLPKENKEYVFMTTLEEIPENGQLTFVTSGSEVRILLDDAELYYASSVQQPGTKDISQADIVLSPDATGKTLTMEYRFLGGENFIFPPLVQIMDPSANVKADTAYANYYAIPAGSFAVLLILVCGLFLLGLSFGKADFTLPVLALAAAGLMVYPISIGTGSMFLSPGLLQVFTWPGMQFLTPVALLVYLLLNRKRSFWKYLGRATLCSAVILLAAYLISFARDGYLAYYLNNEFYNLFLYGIYSNLLYWLTVYLTAACSLIAGSGAAYSFAKIRSEAHILKLKNSLLDENFHVMERSVRQTAAMRHELKHNITALHLLYQKGDFDSLGNTLAELDKQQAGLTQMQFTDNFILNTLLQNTAADAAEKEIGFEAHALVPEELHIEDRDLCSFVMNLLDNAIEACMKISDPAHRFIRFHAELKQGFLAISCTNSCSVNPIKENQEFPESTKPEKSVHGFGFRQMKAIAKKYNSVLNVECDDKTFTVQTALKTTK